MHFLCFRALRITIHCAQDVVSVLNFDRMCGGSGLGNLVSLYARLPPQPSLDGIPLPLFVPGPGGLWISTDPYRAPTSVWDLVVKTPTFVPVPVIEEKVEISAEYQAILDCPPSPPPTGTNTANIDPCYQTPRYFPPLTTTIKVLPTIPESRQVRFALGTKHEDSSSSHGGFRRRIKDKRSRGRAVVRSREDDRVHGSQV